MGGNKGSSEKLNTQGQHLLADLFGVESAKLKDPSLLVGLLKESAATANLTPSGEPQIVRYRESCAGSIFLKESNSRISFNAYPEANYLAIDIFTRGDSDPEKVFNLLVETLAPQMVRKTVISRGLQD